MSQGLALIHPCSCVVPDWMWIVLNLCLRLHPQRSCGVGSPRLKMLPQGNVLSGYTVANRSTCTCVNWSLWWGLQWQVRLREFEVMPKMCLSMYNLLGGVITFLSSWEETLNFHKISPPLCKSLFSVFIWRNFVSWVSLPISANGGWW